MTFSLLENRSFVIGLVAVATSLLLLTNFVSFVKILVQPINDHSICPIYETRAPASFYKDNSTVLKILYDENYKAESVARLSGAVKVDTQIGDDWPGVDEQPETWAHFAKFHDYLEKTFPRVYKATKLTKVNTYGLLYEWKGRNPALKPLLLMAHQDVVPVQKETLTDWEYAPFEGHFDGKYVYGRGAWDCKNSLIAVMEALELLAEQGFKPERGVLVSFGFDEESTGVHGANHLAQHIEDKFGKDSIYAIIDEGPGIMKDDLTGMLIAAPGTGEKGDADLSVKLFMEGGHSSVPPEHGAIGIMGELAYRIEQDQYSPLLIPKNPVLGYLQCLASHSGNRMSKLQKKAIFRAAYDKLANSKVVEVLSKNRFSSYLIKTSQAIDVVRGGEKANALPEEVHIVVNHRITVGMSVHDVQTRFAERVKALAEKYSLNVEAFGEVVYEAPNSVGTFKIANEGHVLEHAPVSPNTGKVWEYLAATNRHVFEDLVLNNTLGYPLVTAPSIMPANTDTRYYWNLTRNIFRFSPMIVDFFDNKIHGVNEKILFDGHLQLTAWYYEYIQNIDSKDAD